MKGNSLLLEYTISFYIISLFITVVNPDLIDEANQRPQIILRDGSMVFQSAVGKNIHFESNGGQVFLNQANLLELAQTVTAAANTINSLHAGVLSDFESRLRLLETTVLGSLGVENRVSQLEQTISNGTSGADLPGNIGAKIKTLNAKVVRLTQVISKIRTTLSTNECSSNPCRNGGTCEDQYNGFLCRCPPNWEGTLCDVDVNECAQFAGTDLGCQNGATCINRIGTYECQCAPGFVGLHCTRKDKGCSKNNPQELCGHGICINQEGVSDGYTCLCDQGWTKSPTSKACTQDVDECTSGRPACSKNPPVSCINLPGTFHCGPCPQGYTGNGFYCVDIDECQINNGGCSMNPSVQCINTQGSRVCGACPPGYQGDGVTCTYLGACRINNGGCHPLAQCLENSAISQSYVQCICPSGYAGSGIGPSGCIPTAVAPISGGSNICQPNPCIHGTCIVAGTSFICRCYSGYTGATCGDAVNPCDSNPCQNSGTCVPQGNGYYCRCSPFTTGMHCEQQQMSCGGRLRSPSGTLKFPPSNEGINYPSQVSCGWLIVTNSTQVLNVTFKSFNLEESPECSFDWLQIHDGHSSAYQLIGRYCGSRIPNAIISTHNVLYLWFRSDRSNQRDGFELTWTSITPICGGDIVFQSHGSLSSPGYPGKYPTNRDCEWRLTAPNRKRIVFHFYTMNIESHSNCSFDFVEIRDGYDNRMVKKFCNTSLPEPLTTPSRRAVIRFHSDGEGRDTGFQISYSTAPSTDCGGVLTSGSGLIVPPLDPDSNKYLHRATCEWVIQLPEGERIKIEFLKLNLENHRSCMFDRVEVHEGRGPSSRLVGRYCGNQLPRPYTSLGNIVTIIFLTDSSVALEGFKIKYQEVCGGIFGEEAGHITSPMYPSKYTRNKNCIYEIQQPLGKSITLNFFDFTLEAKSRYSSRCYDFVEIRDGHDEKAPLLGQYCGTQFPPTIVSTYNYLWLKFHTDSSREYKGFYANYTTEDVSCGGIIRNQEGTIQTPRYPNFYPNNHMCRWVIVADAGNVINLNWINFNLEGETGMYGDACSFDYVEVYENVTEGQPGVRVGNKRYCGNVSPPNMTSTSNIVTIVFRTDYSIRFTGFIARYLLTDASNLCSANFVSSTGTILSPGYPSSYPHNIDCTWTISVPSGQQILLNVSDFWLERHSNCMWDYLEIRNGILASSPLIGRYCGREISTPIPSHSNHLYLRFKTDYSHSLRGFNITWDGTITGCGGTLTGKSGHIVSPYYPHEYSINTECFYKISTSQGSIVQVIFLDFDLEYSRRCLYDYLAFYDGVDSSGKLLGKYCSNSHPLLIRSNSNNMFIKFKSDSSHHGRGFSIKYDTVCEVTLSGFGGVIESPNFPNRYPSNLNCKWTIAVKNGNYINVTFSHFMLESSEHCEHDYLQIAEGSTNDIIMTPRGKLCGSTVPQPLTSSSNKMVIEMKTDDSMQFSGFRLEWHLHGCGAHITDQSGEITSPNYPHGYADNIECEWLITTALDKSIELTIHDFDIEGTGNCNFDVLRVYGGPDTTSPALHPGLCHKLTQEMKLTSSGSNMLLTFTADSSYSGRGFKLSYKSVDSVCGGYFVTPSGYIHSHNFPSNYDPHDDCLWYIEVEKNHVVQLSFLTFDLEMSTNCTYDYVKVFDGNSTESPEIATLCGNVLPNITSYRSTGNTMVLRMKADGSLNGPGFSANYTTACGARIVTEDYGTISLANAINANRENQNCSWVIIGAQPQDRVTLTITHMDLSPRYENFGDVCEYGYLEVYEGEDKSSTPLGPFCGSSAPPPIISQGSALLLHLVSLYGASYGYFSASYSVIQGACGGNFTSELGAFSSPEYPNTYSINSECVWTISTSPGNRVTVGFRAFELEQSDNCNKDYLEVRANSAEGNLIGVYCQDLPSNITASQTLWIKFHSDGDGTARGFLADYSLIHGNELEGQSGQIASPLYPRPYLQESEYSWRVTVAVGSAIRITFREFYIESFSDSCDMFLAIYDGYDDTAPELMKKCGTMVPDPITSSSNMVYIYMSSMGVRHGSFFFLEWLQVERTPVPRPTPLRNLTCGGMIYLGNHTSNSSVSEYILTSPGYPYGYRHGLRCEWIIQTPQLYHPVILFTAMDLERNTRCTVDYVSVYSATDQSGEWKLLNTLCQTNATLTPPIDAYNMMKVVFRTDYSVNRTGFAAKVYPACGGSVKMPNGVIEVDNTTSGSSQNYFMQCQWNITVRPGRTIKVAFDRFYIRNDRSDIAQCGDLYLKIQNGHYADSPSLGQPKYCGTELPVIPESTSNHISITYKNIRGGQGFKLRFFEESVSCGGSYTLSRFDNSMEISSPGFPNSPLPHIECIWTFMAPGGEALQVDFDPIFDFQSSKGCEADYVELRDGGTQNSRLINRFCIRPPSTQRSTQNMIWIKFFTNTYDHPSRFKANVSIARCGGIIRNWRGDIRSPGYPRQYPSNTQCTWRIEVVHYSSITIGFQDVDLPISTPCNSSDYVSVSEYSPFLQTTRLLNTVCGQNPPEPIQVASMMALIDFKSFGAQADRYKGFSLNFSSTYENCGGELTAPSGEIKNPDYPSGTRYRSCIWTIIVPKSRRVTVDLVTVDMDLAERYSSDISFYNYQYSYFIDSLWRNRTLRRVESSSNIMKVYFYIRTNRPVRFLMRYSSDQPEACGGVLQGPNGSFSYPVISGSSFFCMWEYNSESSVNGTLAVTFRNVTIGRNSNFYSCRYSGSKIKVTSADENQILYSTCGNYTKPQTIVSPFSKTKIIIAMSRVAMTYEGQYSISPCGGVLTGPEENVTSPGYPNNYPPNVHCAWAVTFPEELRITIKFNAMQLEETCSNDYLLIFNGPLPTSPLIDRFCGSHLHEDIISQGNTLWIEFHSNGNSQFKGFSLSLSSLSSGCGGVIHNKDRAILSPNYPSQYPPNMECEWEIRTDEGYFIQLRFVDRFQLEDSDNCDNDFVEVYDYYESSYVSIKKLCGREVHRVMTSTGTRMKIRFKSNQNIQGDGFKIQWTPQCGGVIENVTEGHIVSPSYPREYGMNLDCNYTVKMPGHWMRAEFDTFELEGQGGTCRYDNVTIVGPPRWSSIMTLGPYCGTNKPPPFVSSNYFSLIFKTDYSVSRSGFLVRFKSITSCGGPINEPGALSSPDTYVEFYHVQINCTWTITAPANSVVVLRFSSFQLPSFCDPSMNGFGVTIYDGPFVNQRYRMATYCGNLDKSPPVIKSTGNKMVLEYLTYSFSSRSNSFHADVLFTYGESAGCGGRRNITSQVQSIHSPDVNSDGRYEPDLDCHWVLRAPPNQIIHLMINNLHLKSCNATTQPTNDCGCDYIEIRDGGTQYDELIGVYCGDRLYRPIMSTSSQLWVRFVTDSYQEDTGFYIDAMAQPRVCSEPLLNVSSTVKFLTSQNYPNNYSPSTRCRWILNAPRKYYRIAIHIEDLNITGDADCTNSRLQITDETANDVVTTEQGDTVVVYGQSQSRRPSHFGYASMIPVSSYSLCGDVRNFNFYSLTGMVSVTFVSNEIASRGFNLSYSLAGCNRNYTSPQGRVLITGPVTNRCVMLIEADQNATISLYFKEAITGNCETDGLEVRDGGSADSPRLARVCSTTVPNPVFSTGNILRLETSSNHFHIDATYTTTTQGRGCGGTIFNYGGIFTSPLYPSNYRNASVCEWTIVVPVGNLAALQFQEFQIGPRSTCETDYVELISVEMPANEEGAQTRYCGDDNPAMFVSASNKLILRYTTSLHNAGTGWIALFMATVPGQRLDDLSQLNGYHFNQIE